MDAQPLQLTAEKTEGWLRNVPPFWGFLALSKEHPEHVLLHSLLPQHSLRFRTRNRGAELNASPSGIEDWNDDQREKCRAHHTADHWLKNIESGVGAALVRAAAQFGHVFCVGQRGDFKRLGHGRIDVQHVGEIVDPRTETKPHGRFVNYLRGIHSVH